jgi:hypothetical protein
MISIFLFLLMLVIALDTAVEYSLTRSYMLKKKFDSTLIWRFIAMLLIMIAIVK